MDAVRKDVEKLTAQELASANKKFPQFSCEHHGFAIIHEEVDELDEAVAILNDNLSEIWVKTKSDTLNETIVQIAYNSAVSAACEAIQVAAMCQKMMDFIKAKKEGGKP